MRAKRRSDLHAHMTQPAQADNAHLVPRADVPLAQWRIGCDAGAQQRRHGGQIGFSVGDAQHKRLPHHQVAGIAAVSVGTSALCRAVVRAGKTVFAILFQIIRAGRAMLAAVNHAAYADHVAYLELADQLAHRRDAAHDFVSGH